MAFVSPSCELEAASIPTGPQERRECRAASQGPVLPRFRWGEQNFTLQQSFQYMSQNSLFDLSVGLSHYTFYIDAQHPSSKARGPIHFIAWGSKYLLEKYQFFKMKERVFHVTL